MEKTSSSGSLHGCCVKFQIYVHYGCLSSMLSFKFMCITDVCSEQHIKFQVYVHYGCLF